MKCRIPLESESMSWFRDELVNNAYKFDFPIHKPYELTEQQKKIDMDRK
jgi:excinuclease ABC subunit A